MHACNWKVTANQPTPPNPLFFWVKTLPRYSKSRKRRSYYSKGKLNRIIDGLIHPLFDRSPAFIIVDVVLHGLIEQNPTETTVKFIRFSLPKIIREIMEKEHRSARKT